jgi:hypothetical protein
LRALQRNETGNDVKGKEEHDEEKGVINVDRMYKKDNKQEKWKLQQVREKIEKGKQKKIGRQVRK